MGDLTLRSGRQYIEIACRPGQRFSQVDEATRERIRRRREAGLYEEVGLITVVVHGVEGSFPAHNAPVDVAGLGSTEASIAAGAEDGIVLVRAERLVAGEMAA
jgi:hypothetical protein